MRIYVAGPLDVGTLATPTNVLNACRAASSLASMGHTPFVPHLSVLWDLITPGRDYEWWISWCLDWVAQCEGLFRLPGASPGADREVELAQELKIPVFTALWEIERHVRVRDPLTSEVTASEAAPREVYPEAKPETPADSGMGYLSREDLWPGDDT